MKKRVTKAKYKRTKTGCMTCRLRRIKCDERHPECTNCSNREIQCIWSEEKPAPAIAERAGITLPPLNLTNLQLLHHFAISTTRTLPHPRVPKSLLFNHQTINNLSVFSPNNSFLVHAILCASATHLAVQTNQASYYTLAVSHFKSAIFQTKLHSRSDLSKGGFFSPRFMCNQLLLASLSAMGGIHSDQLFFSEIIIMSCRGVIVRASDVVPPDGLPLTISTSILPTVAPHIIFPTQRFLSLIDTCNCIDPEELLDPLISSAYHTAVFGLEYAWRTFTNPHYGVVDVSFSPRWACALPTRFMTLLHERRPRSLIILAHYCAIMLSFKQYWHMRDIRRDLVQIAALIEERWFEDMVWPLSILRYVHRD